MTAATRRPGQLSNIRRANVVCRDCGQRIPCYYGPKDDILCSSCRHPLSYRRRGGVAPDDDDPSGPLWAGASSSWDMIVRAYEDIPDNVLRGA